MAFFSLLLWALAIVALPVLFVAWLLESQEDKARRWRAAGWSQQRIADRLGVSRAKVRRILA